MQLKLIFKVSLINVYIEFAHHLYDFDVDIVLGTETWLTEEIKYSELCLYNYEIFRKDRISRGGGVFIAVKKCLCSDIIESCNDVESMFVKVKVQGRKSVILYQFTGRQTHLLIFAPKLLIKSMNRIYNKNK